MILGQFDVARRQITGLSRLASNVQKELISTRGLGTRLGVDITIYYQLAMCVINSSLNIV